MDSLQLIGILLGAAGFWKVVEVFFKVRADKRLHKAEEENLKASASSQIIDNWVGWAQKLEKRVEELESDNQKMEETINKQRSRINDLEKFVTELKERNRELLNRLKLNQNGRKQ